MSSIEKNPLFKFFKSIFVSFKGNEFVYIKPTKTKLNIRNIPHLINALNRLGNIRDNVFSEFILYNVKVLSEYADALGDKLKAKLPPEYEAYQKEMTELNEKFSLKDANQKKVSVVEDGKKVVYTRHAIECMYKALDEKYKECLEAKEKVVEEGRLLTEGDTEIEVFILPRPALPEQISANEKRTIEVLIEPLK